MRFVLVFHVTPYEVRAAVFVFAVGALAFFLLWSQPETPTTVETVPAPVSWHHGGEGFPPGWFPPGWPPTTTTTSTIPAEPPEVVAAGPAISAPQVRQPGEDSPPLGQGVGGTLETIRECESGGVYTTNTGNGYFGAYQADYGTWGGYGGYETADLAPPHVQDAWALELIAVRGMAPWPVCGQR